MTLFQYGYEIHPDLVFATGGAGFQRMNITYPEEILKLALTGLNKAINEI
jgi:bifunctional pyridoxal-dependent enzyme with beta-cystathionase and maltose regulon repressor activities